MAAASSAQAQRPVSLGEGAPVGQSGIQLYNFSSYLSNGAGEILCPASPAPPTPYCVGPTAPTTTMARMERLFAFLQSRGRQERRALRLPGQSVPEREARRRRQPAGRARAARARRPVRDPLPGPSRQPRTRRAGTAEIAISRILGQDHIGESGPGGAGGVGTLPGDAADGAVQLNKLGKRSVEAGPRPGVLPQSRGRSSAPRSGSWTTACSRAAWEIMMERTDPRWVVAQIDIGWAVCGGSGHVGPVRPGRGHGVRAAA